MRQRVVVYVERGAELLVFDHRGDPEAGTQVPAGGVLDGEALPDAVVREVSEETGLELRAEPVYLGDHEHLDGLGRPARSSFFRVEAPTGAPGAGSTSSPARERTPASSSAAASTQPRPSGRCRRSTDNRDEEGALLARSAALVAVPSGT